MLLRWLILLLLTGPILAGCDRQSPAPEQAERQAANGPVPPPMPDEMPATPANEKVIHEAIGTLDRSHAGAAADGSAFVDPSGGRVTIADFAGRPVLLNLWATWCAPCVAEMPTLDALAARLGSKVQVLTVSQDLEGAAKVAPFFARGKFTALKPYLDRDANLSIAYQANLPTTILFDSRGREVWRMSGGMDWTGSKAAELIAEAK